MAHDILQETMIPLLKARELFPIAPHEHTLYRWVNHGLSGVKLESIQVGRYRVTSIEAVGRFVRRSDQGPMIQPAAAAPVVTRDVADRILEAAGI